MTRFKPISYPLAVSSGLLALWLAGGLMTVLLAAALVDLTISVVEWRHERAPSAKVPHERR